MYTSQVNSHFGLLVNNLFTIRNLGNSNNSTVQVKDINKHH